MKITDNQLVQGLQGQLTFEYFSEKVYQSLRWQLDALNLVGMARYLKKRGKEESYHAKKLARYISDRGISPIVDAVPAPTAKVTPDVFKAGAQAFAAALTQEQVNTKRLHDLYTIAEGSDPDTCIFLQWYLTEQIEEEKSLQLILTKFELAGNDGDAIMRIDHQLRN